MAKTIKIFLIDGEPDGFKQVELSNWSGQAFVIPRKNLKHIKARQDCNKPAIYFLVGKESEGALLNTVYIGEAENLRDRLGIHDGTKEFWHTVIAFVSKDNNLTKAHVKYLESRCIEIALRVKRVDLENEKKPTLPSLSDSDVAEMEEFLDNLRLLLAAVGFPILKEVTKKEEDSPSEPVFYCASKKKGTSATGRMTNEGFVVYKDSTATNKIAPSIQEISRRNLDKLIMNGYVEKKNDDTYTFTKDYVFTSPSAASDIILGSSTNGWKKWKSKEGTTLDEFINPPK